MKISERAFQFWLLLVLCSTKRQLISFKELGKLIGVPNSRLELLFEPIQNYCI